MPFLRKQEPNVFTILLDSRFCGNDKLKLLRFILLPLFFSRFHVHWLQAG